MIPILGITAQFINKQDKLQSLVLAIKEVNRDYLGENLLKYIIEVLIEYKIKENLGYFVIDNAPNNNTIMASLSLSLQHNYKL